MKKFTPSSRAASPGRRIAGRAQDDPETDPYRRASKLKEPAVCQGCGAVYSGGRWRWAERPADARPETCPACRRVRDRYPAGTLVLKGPAALQHKDELLRLARGQEAAENPEHPLNRIMGVEETEEGIVITTTDIHLPRRIGEAVRRAFHGELRTHFDEAAYSMRAQWSRD